MPLGVLPIPLSAVVMHQTCPDVVPATTVLVGDVLGTTPFVPSLAGEATLCGIAQ